jgi:dihydrodipicolinate synthase/N-acetylneuraminate lyase
MSRPAASDLIARLRPNRRIEGCSAILLPYRPDGTMDLDGFRAHLLRTARAGLTPAVNMDTGFGPQLTPAERSLILRETRAALGPRAAFIAGAQPFNAPGDPLAAYRASVDEIVAKGGTPIVFQSPLFQGRTGQDLERLYREIIRGAPKALAFELGPQFAPFGRIYAPDDFSRLLVIPNLTGAKHSSLSRLTEIDRLATVARERPGFHIYTGNDLAIDMVMYGSEYLLGLSTFDPDAFALRDRWWEEGDPRFHELNDALQALGAVAFRDPVPAYKSSAAAYLSLTGHLPGALPHPACPLRPAWEADLLRPLAEAIRRAAVSLS